MSYDPETGNRCPTCGRHNAATLLAERDAARAEVERRATQAVLLLNAMVALHYQIPHPGSFDNCRATPCQDARAALKEPSGPLSTPPLMQGADGAESNPVENAQGMVNSKGGNDR